MCKIGEQLVVENVVIYIGYVVENFIVRICFCNCYISKYFQNVIYCAVTCFMSLLLGSASQHRLCNVKW
jgi:hypothetical protein